MTAPFAQFRLTCGDRTDDYLVNGDSSQYVFVLSQAPTEPVAAVEEGQPPAAASAPPAEELVSLADLEEKVPGGFRKTEGVPDPLADPDPAQEEQMRLKYADFYRAGGRVIETPEEEHVATDVAADTTKWSIGIHPGDFLVPVCHQGMNRSQIMRLALTGVVKQLQSEQGNPPQGLLTPWVSRAHGAVSGCDAHSAYGSPEPLDEMNFFAYLFDEGKIFHPDYVAKDDDDPQEGPLQRGFESTFGEKKQPRIGEEMARVRKLNPTSEYTSDREFAMIGEDRLYTHNWFNKWVFASPETIWVTDQMHHEKPLEQLTIPPQGTNRRIYFCFARAVAGVIDRLLEAKGCHNSVVVSLDYKDNMNNELRHCQGKTLEELEQTMHEVHLKTYNMYASLIHADPSPGPLWQDAPPEPEPEPPAPIEQPAAGAGDGRYEKLAELGVPPEITTHLMQTTYFKMNSKGPKSGKSTDMTTEYEVDDVFRLLSLDATIIGRKTYVHLRAVVDPTIDGLVHQAHCADLDENDLIQLAFNLMEHGLPEMPATETEMEREPSMAATGGGGAAGAAGGMPEAEKQKFMQWATSPEQGMNGVEAESVWERQVRKGGELTGDPIADACEQVRQLRHEKRQVAAASAPPVGIGAPADQPTRIEEYVWRVTKDSCGNRQLGGPGTDIILEHLQLDPPGAIQLFVPLTAVPGSEIVVHVERNLVTGEPREIFNSIGGVMYMANGTRMGISGPARPPGPHV